MTDTAKPVFHIQRIYTRDVSFESPHAPETFRQEWKPEVGIDLQTKSRPLEEGVFEVVLMLTANVKNNDKVAFCVEVQQAGIFTIQNVEENVFGHLLGSVCPNTLYPYARQTITDLVVKGGFPPLVLAPVNFDALYAQHQAEDAAAKEPELDVV